MATYLSVQHLDASYGDIRALWSANIRVEQGEIVALIGPNGAGKTTLLRVISGLHRNYSGSVMLGSLALQGLAAHRIVEEGVILVPEGRRLFASLSVMDNLLLGAYSRRARRDRNKTLQHVFELFPILAERLGQRAGTLSGGQQQMLALGRALMGLPRLLLLDEPSLGLAPKVVQDIFEKVVLLNKEGVTILLVEQNAVQALEIADRGYILERGNIVGTGAGKALLHDEEVRRAYLGFEPEAA